MSARLDLSLTQADLASRCGFNRKTISLWETGQVQPSIRHMRILAEVLDRPVPWLRASDLEERTNGRH